MLPLKVVVAEMWLLKVLLVHKTRNTAGVCVNFFDTLNIIVYVILQVRLINVQKLGGTV